MHTLKYTMRCKCAVSSPTKLLFKSKWAVISEYVTTAIGRKTVGWVRQSKNSISTHQQWHYLLRVQSLTSQRCPERRALERGWQQYHCASQHCGGYSTLMLAKYVKISEKSFVLLPNDASSNRTNTICFHLPDYYSARNYCLRVNVRQTFSATLPARNHMLGALT